MSSPAESIPLAGPAGPTARRARRLLPWLLVAAAAVAPYATTLNHELVFDDARLLPTVGAFHDPLDATALLWRPHWGDDSLFRPLGTWSLAGNFALNRACGLDGLHVVGFRLLNILLHLLVCLALRRWLLDLRQPEFVATAVALLFAVHPVHTEAVSAIVGRAELLAACGGLAFLILHGRRRFALAAAALLLALGSKESAVVFLPVALLSDALLRAGALRENARPHLRYGLILLAFLAWRGAVVRPAAIPFLDNPLAGAPLLRRLATAAVVQLDYLRLQFWPVRLSSDYSFDQVPLVGPGDPLPWLFVSVVVLSLTLAVRLRRSRPLPACAMAAYGIAVLPTANLLFPIGTVMAERLLYTPSLFLLLALVGALPSLSPAQRRGAGVALGLLGVALATRTAQRNATWADPLTFHLAQASSAPRSARAHFGLGFAYARAGRLEQALAEYDRALAIYPPYADAHFNRANARRGAGYPLAAIVAGYRDTLRHDPAHRGALFNLGRLLLEAGRDDEAGELLDRLARLDPAYTGAEPPRR